MSGDTTKSQRGMDCGRVAREDILEGYLLGRLSEEDRDTFEQHYFECARCYEDLKALHAIMGELRASSAPGETATLWRSFRWAFAAGMAAAVLMAVAILALPPTWRGRQPVEASRPSRPQSAQSPLRETPAPAPAPLSVLEQLARVDPPPYEFPRMRSVPDEATVRFERGMQRYGKRDYPGALDELRAAERLDPEAPHIRFFLGITLLMLRQDDAAIDRLRAVIALGDSPYLEEARVYLAKALLRHREVAAARAQLREVERLGGSQSAEARRLIAELDAFGLR